MLSRNCHYCLLFLLLVETDCRDEEKVIRKEDTALLQEEQRKLAKNVDELKGQLQHQTKTLHSRIVAAQISHTVSSIYM